MKRAASERAPKEAASGVPVLVHRCSDERTLTAAAGFSSPGDNGIGEVFAEADPLRLLLRSAHWAFAHQWWCKNCLHTA